MSNSDDEAIDIDAYDSTDAWDKEVESTETPEFEEADVIPYEISYYPADLTLKGYYDKSKSKQLQIPEFQRSYVWDRVKASKLIESFLLGLPVPGVFLYKQRKTNNLLVIDGQQRIATAIKYFDNEFEDGQFRLKNVSDKWNGKRYQDLSEAEKFQLDDSVLRATIVQQLDPQDDSSIYHIFERLNTGGVNLTPMEVRKCVHYGEYFDMLERLNQHESWRRIIKKPKLDKRLRDVELVLRVIALRHSWRNYEKPMKQFLNNHIETMRRLGPDESTQRIEQDHKEFCNACDLIESALPETPFHLRGRLNYAAMDAMLSLCMEGHVDDAGKLRSAYESALTDEDFQLSVSKSTSDEKVVNKRFNVVLDLLRK